jgi:tetratricopeptide (TPR) repeat protein
MAWEASDTAQAETYFNKSIELDPNLLQTYLDLGRLYMNQETMTQDNRQKAIEKLEASLKVTPDFVQAHMILGMIYERLTQYDKAKLHYEHAMRINPKFGPAATNLAWLYAEQGGNLDTAVAGKA